MLPIALSANAVSACGCKGISEGAAAPLKRATSIRKNDLAKFTVLGTPTDNKKSRAVLSNDPLTVRKHGISSHVLSILNRGMKSHSSKYMLNA